MRYVHERTLAVLPTFAVVPASAASTPVVAEVMTRLGADHVLHAAEELVVHRPVPARASATSHAHVVAIGDTGRAAVVVVEASTVADDGRPLATTWFHLALPGRGGFGGQRPDSWRAPPNDDGQPLAVLQSPTSPAQAAWFRLSSDRTPIHIDPDAARAAGFDAPLLQGLCTWGVVGKAIVDHVLDGDPTRVASYRARFTAVVYPGDRLATTVWRDAGDVTATTTASRPSGEDAERVVLSDVRLAMR